MRHKIQFLLVASSLALPLAVLGQGTFQNLDFESANLPTIPAGSFGGFVSVGLGLPGWNAYLGTNQQGQVLHNSVTLGASVVGIMGTDFSFLSRIEGSYTALMIAGVNPDTGIENASIAQTGMVPGTARSIQFKAKPGNGDFTVSIGGQAVPMAALQIFPNYTLFGGEISLFAGQTAELLNSK